MVCRNLGTAGLGQLGRNQGSVVGMVEDALPRVIDGCVIEYTG
jgi:hypothetical protein